MSCSGGRYVIDDDGDVPDVQEVLWQYPKMTMTWMSMLANSYGFDFHGDPVPRRRLGIYFHGANGTMYCDYGMHKIVPEGDRMQGVETPPVSIPSSPGHEIEWVNCIKTRQQPSCSVFYHTKVDVPLVLGQPLLQTGPLDRLRSQNGQDHRRRGGRQGGRARVSRSLEVPGSVFGIVLCDLHSDGERRATPSTDTVTAYKQIRDQRCLHVYRHSRTGRSSDISAPSFFPRWS